MGNCINCLKYYFKYENTLVKFAIKFPHGTKYIEYSDKYKKFIKDDNINNWLNNLYKDSKWTNWILYNDETQKIGNKNTSKGHCKGIITWNRTKIGWLCHSLPNFPSEFKGNKIGLIEHGELIYGQSFQYIEINFDYNLIYNILNQVNIMEAHVYLEKYAEEYSYLKKIFSEKRINERINDINSIKLSDNITHIAKSPHYEIDIYNDYIMKKYDFNWKFETWIRGHLIKNNKIDNDKHNKNHIEDIIELNYEDIKFEEKQDHSKWGVSDDKYYWIGDLNRMTSQFKRGGGGFICKDKNIVKELNKLILLN